MKIELTLRLHAKVKHTMFKRSNEQRYTLHFKKVAHTYQGEDYLQSDNVEIEVSEGKAAEYTTGNIYVFTTK